MRIRLATPPLPRIVLQSVFRNCDAKKEIKDRSSGSSSFASLSAAKPVALETSVANPVTQILRKTIPRLLQEIAPNGAGPTHPSPEALNEQQLAHSQGIGVRPDGLCLAHACVGAFGANAWGNTHSFTGLSCRWR